MKEKSKKVADEPKNKEFLNKPYDKIPKKIGERLEPRDYIATDKAVIRHDGKQFVVRIPLKISKTMELDKNKSYYLEFTARKPPPNKEGKSTVEIKFGEK